jgi:hypothetical protein
MAKASSETDETVQKNFRLKKSTAEILDRLCASLVPDPSLKVSESKVVDLAIREYAKARGIK